MEEKEAALIKQSGSAELIKNLNLLHSEIHALHATVIASEKELKESIHSNNLLLQSVQGEVHSVSRKVDDLEAKFNYLTDKYDSLKTDHIRQEERQKQQYKELEALDKKYSGIWDKVRTISQEQAEKALNNAEFVERIKKTALEVTDNKVTNIQLHWAIKLVSLLLVVVGTTFAAIKILIK